MPSFILPPCFQQQFFQLVLFEAPHFRREINFSQLLFLNDPAAALAGIHQSPVRYWFLTGNGDRGAGTAAGAARRSPGPLQGTELSASLATLGSNLRLIQLERSCRPVLLPSEGGTEPLHLRRVWSITACVILDGSEAVTGSVMKCVSEDGAAESCGSSATRMLTAGPALQGRTSGAGVRMENKQSQCSNMLTDGSEVVLHVIKCTLTAENKRNRK